MNSYDITYKTLYDYTYEKIPAAQRSAFDEIELGRAVSFVGTTFFTSLLSSIFEATIDTPLVTTEVNNLYCLYIYPKYKDLAIGFGEDNDEVNKNCKKTFRLLVNRIRTTYDEYKKLIDLYDSIKSNLLAEIKTQTKFNDTPQTETTGGVTSYDDTYNSTVSTVYSEGASKIARLKEVELNIRDYYEKWCEVVTEGIFIYEG